MPMKGSSRLDRHNGWSVPGPFLTLAFLVRRNWGVETSLPMIESQIPKQRWNRGERCRHLSWKVSPQDVEFGAEADPGKSKNQTTGERALAVTEQETGRRVRRALQGQKDGRCPLIPNRHPPTTEVSSKTR